MSRGVTIDIIGGLCPVQAEGRIDGMPFYFRARGERWSLEIGQLGSDPGLDPPLWTMQGWHGVWPDAGYIDEHEARSLIAQAVKVWRGWGHMSASDFDRLQGDSA